MSKIPHRNNRKDLNLYKTSLTLSQKQHEIIKGTILGDGNLIQGGKYSHLRFEQKNKDYLFHLYDIFKDWTRTAPIERRQKRLVTSEFTYSWYCATISHPQIQTYRELFYPNGKKILTATTIDFILSSPAVLAYWYMDDGTKHCYGYRILTCGFSLEENNLLAKALLVKFDLKVNIHKQRSYYLLYITAGSKNRFKELVEPYIVPSMRYKL
jgi:hypothetical protein